MLWSVVNEQDIFYNKSNFRLKFSEQTYKKEEPQRFCLRNSSFFHSNPSFLRKERINSIPFNVQYI